MRLTVTSHSPSDNSVTDKVNDSEVIENNTNITHSHASASVDMATTQLREKAKIRPLTTPKPQNRSSPKLACVLRHGRHPTSKFL